MVGQEFGLSGILGKTKTLAGYVKMPPLINIGILIAHIYHGKIIQDRTDDKRMKSREPVPNFLYNFLIRQYGWLSESKEFTLLSYHCSNVLI